MVELPIHPLLRSRIGELVRYGGVGIALSAAYIALTTVYIEFAKLPALTASIAAFVTSLPFAYLGHRYVTFRSSGSHASEAGRFFVAMTSAFVISSASTAIFVNGLSLHYWVALLVTTILVPLGNYIILKLWVFRKV